MTKVFRMMFLIVVLVFGKPVFAQNYINGPWAVSWDLQYNRYLVSSYDNGRIVAIDTSGQQSIFKEIADCTGNHVSGDTLFVSNGNDVFGLNLDDTDIILQVPIPGSNLVDGLVTDTSGYLYCVDINTRQIHKIDRSDLSVTLFVSSGLPFSPHNMLFEPDSNRLLLASGMNNAPILGIQLPDGELSTVVVTTFNSGDGITSDDFGNTYVSSFALGNVYRYDSLFTNPPFLFWTGQSRAGSISYNKRDHILAIPDYNADSVAFVRDLYHIDSDEDLVFDAYDNCINTQNPEQEDTDSDEVGDSCDNCILISNPGQIDSDSDNVGDSCDNCVDVYNPDQADGDLDSIGDACDYICGDSDGSESVDIDDVVYLIQYIFAGGSQPDPLEAGDADCSGGIDIDDVVYLINYIFAGGSSPCDPDGDEVPDC